MPATVRRPTSQASSRRILIAGIVASSLLTAGAWAGPGKARHARFDAATAIAWGQCSGSAALPGVECGYLSVPLVYSNPGGQQIQLAVSRLKHVSSNYQGVILAHPGGPGASGLTVS